MKLSKVSDARFQIRVKAVKEYLLSDSVKDVASFFNICPKTLRRWIKRYQEGGEENLKRIMISYRRHPRRFHPVLEKKIVLLKESNPGITIIEAQKIIKKSGIKISPGGIQRVWSRYNLTGFHKEDEFSETSEVRSGIEEATGSLDKGDIHRAAQILNSLPLCSGKDILKKIPDRLLSLSKKLEKLGQTFYDIPFTETAHKAKTIGEKAKKKNLLYTSLRAGILELHALDWDSNYKEQLSLIRKLKKSVEKIKGRSSCVNHLRTEILISEARSLGHLGKIEKAIVCTKTIDNTCCSLSYRHLAKDLASLHSVTGFHKRARFWLEKSLECDKDNESANLYLSASLAVAGDYDSAYKILKRLPKENVGKRALAAIVYALCSLGQGEIEEATKFANQALSVAKEREVPQHMWSSNFTLVCCLCSLGKKAEAIKLLKEGKEHLKKFRMKKESFFVALLLDRNSLPREATLMPPTKLLMLLKQASESLKIKDYRRALDYASTQQIMGYFHKFVLLFPEPVNKLIVRGKSTGLPKPILKLPVFNREVLSYNIKFLGNLIVYKNQKYLRVKLKRKDAAFLIHLTLRAGQSGKKIPLESLYDNFWRNVQHPNRNLSHVLVRIRKALKIPYRLLHISYKQIIPFLINRGIYFTTDYSQLEQYLVRAKAFQKIEEWGTAKKEYLRAFALFRGEPFKKMYDPWSEHMRRVILNKLETEVLHFAKSCLEHGNPPNRAAEPKSVADAKKVLEKVAKIIPQSEEIEKMVREYGGNGVSEKQR